jgi:aspartate carbamoyltransferase regulatory subunit
MEDSGMPITEISKKLLLNRNTVSKIIAKLNKDYIERYTVQVKEPENSLYIIAETTTMDGIENQDIIEHFKLNNGNYLVIMNRDALSADLKYVNLHMAYQRMVNNASERIDLYCDYCNALITGKPHIYDVNKTKFYFCCDTCKGAYIESKHATK